MVVQVQIKINAHGSVLQATFSLNWAGLRTESDSTRSGLGPEWHGLDSANASVRGRPRERLIFPTTGTVINFSICCTLVIILHMKKTHNKKSSCAVPHKGENEV